jgi:hypothetical protein
MTSLEVEEVRAVSSLRLGRFPDLPWCSSEGDWGPGLAAFGPGLVWAGQLTAPLLLAV